MSMDDSDNFKNCIDQDNPTDLILKEFKQWIKDQKKFPKNIPEVLIKRFLKVCDNDLKQAQDLILLNYKLRSSAPSLFTNRDATTKEMQIASKVLRFCPLPKLTKDKFQIAFGGMRDTDPNMFNYADCIKMILMMFDTRFCSYDNNSDNEIAEGEIVIADMGGMTFKHLFNVIKNFTIAKFYMHYFQEACPIKICQINIVNPSAVMDRMFSLSRPFMKKELMDMIIFHRNFESLHEQIGKENLPAEYGGTGDFSMDEVQDNFMEKILSFRDTLMDNDNWRLSE